MSAVFRALEGPPSRPSKVGPVANGGTSQQIVLRRATRRPVSKKTGAERGTLLAWTQTGPRIGRNASWLPTQLPIAPDRDFGHPAIILNHSRSANMFALARQLSDVLPVVAPNQDRENLVWVFGYGESRLMKVGSPRLLVAVFSLAILPQTVWRRGGTRNDRFRRIERH
jgi:hypothetical protein